MDGTCCGYHRARVLIRSILQLPMVRNAITSCLLMFSACGTSSVAEPAASTVPGVQASAVAESPVESAAPAGLMISTSSGDFAATLARAREAITGKGLKIMAEVDHAANAKTVGATLAPTTLLVFGNPKAGTQLMLSQRSVAIDLPMKLLVWQDDAGVHVAYNDPAHLAARHSIADKDPLVGKMQGALAGIAAAATGK